MEYIDLLRLKEERYKFFTEEESLRAVRNWGYNLIYVKHQTEEMCLEAVKQNGFYLSLIINQTEQMCREAYKQNSSSVQYIRIDIKDEKLRKAKEDSYKYFTLEESLEAVRENGYNIRHVRHQTEKICLEAVRQNGYVLTYVINQTEEICIETYKNKPDSVVYIRDTLEAYRKRRLNLIKDMI